LFITKDLFNSMCSCWCIKFYSVNVQEMLIPQSVTDTESTTLDIGGFSDTSQSLPGLGDAGKKIKRKKEKKKHKHKHKHKHHRGDKKEKDRTDKEREVTALSSESSGPPSPDMGLTF